MRNLLEAARCVEAGRQFVGERLVVDETVCASRADGLLVEVLGIERAAFDGGNVRTREEARLKLADEVPAGDESQPRILRQMLLEPALVELGIVERVELRGQAAEGPDESQLSSDDVGDVAEPELARELEA